MTQEQVYAFNSNISQFAGTDLEELKKLIDIKIREEQERAENFMLHDWTDNYIYVVYYLNGEYHYYCKGKEAYKRYLNDADAIKVARKTKDLFPNYETILEKEIAKA